jgi:hypothetical protein
MNRFMAMTIVALLLAAAGAVSAAEKGAIDWPARAATVKVGMSRAEVEKILPRWGSPDLSATVLVVNGSGITRYETYFVALYWRVRVDYDFTGSKEPVISVGRLQIGEAAQLVNSQNRLRAPVKVEKLAEPIWTGLNENESPIVLRALAATVKVGMTRAEVEKILPRRRPSCGVDKVNLKSLERERDALNEGVDPGRQYNANKLGTNTLLLTNAFFSGGVYASLGSRGPGWIAEWYQVSEDWVVTVTYDDTDSKGVKGFSVENRVVGPLKVERMKKPAQLQPWAPQ